MEKYICATCGKEFESNLKYKTPKYCSRKCHDSHYKRPNDYCIVCGKPLPKGRSNYCCEGCRAQVNNSKYYSDRGYTPHGELTKTCIVCGAEFKTYRTAKETCSEDCKVKWRERALHSDKRLNLINVIDDDITLDKVYEKDNGVCYLCGEKCDYSDIEKRKGHAIVHSMYPSIDHVIPLSRGGCHSWDNVRLAHLGCNARKHNKVR